MSDLAARLSNLSPEKRALLEKRLQQKTVVRTAAAEPIAIVGMACRFPGAPTPEAFWQLIERGGDAIRAVPPARWDTTPVYDTDTSRPGTTNSRHGGFLDDVELFDAPFFGISPREAARMDPQQRLFLEVAWEALEDAGQDVEALTGSDTGVFVGLHGHAHDYFWFDVPHPERMDAFTGPGTSHNMVAGRLAYLFDFHGPAMVVDTACSSSLVAIHLACQSLRNAECTLALAGGVNLVLSPVFTIALSRLGMLSPDGHCRAFDAGANGFVRSEGCGVIALKRLADAQAAGDRVLALIRGSAVNQDGRTNGITAPSSPSQQRVLSRALANAGVSASQLGYVEAHGTGTQLGDPIEAEALGAIIGPPDPSGAPCYLGSAKANVGHLEGAAGVAGVIKTLLALQHRTIPPLALFQSLNPHITLQGTRLRVPTSAQPWEATHGRFAGVSSFGWSGTNAHVVLEEAPVAPAGPEMPRAAALILPIAARSESALRDLASAYAQRLEAGDADPAHLCAAAAVRRTHHDFRLAAAGRTNAELLSALRAHQAGEAHWLLSTGRAVTGRRTPAVFVFSGQGSQWAGMGRELLESNATFRRVIEDVDAVLKPMAGWSVIEALAADPSASRLQDTEIAQPAIFALQVGLAAAYQAIGIEPAAVTGHSVGELAAAHVAGALELGEAVRLACHRARLMQRATGHGRMVAIDLSAADAGKAIGRDAHLVSVAAVNAPRSCVLSGDPDAVERICARLEQEGITCRPLPVNYAFHSVQMEDLAQELREVLGTVAAKPTRLPMVSSVTGDVIEGTALDAGYWARNVRQPVQFARAMTTLMGRGQQLFLEVGPHPVLASSIRLCTHDGASAIAVPSLQRARSDTAALMSSVGALYTHGVAIDWSRVFPVAPAMALPRYPWQRTPFWLPAGSVPAAPAGNRPQNAHEEAASAKAIDTLVSFEHWAPLPPCSTTAGSERARFLLVMDQGGAGESLARKLEAAGHECIRVHSTTAADDGELAAAVIAAMARPLSAIVHARSLDDDAAPAATAMELITAQRKGYASVLTLLQTLARTTGALPKLYVLTAGTQSLNASPARVPAQAPVWAMARVAAREHPELRVSCIDFDRVDETLIDRVLIELHGGDGESEIAYRGGTRFGRRLRVRTEQPAACSHVGVVRSDRSYLITGGLGSLGLSVAQWLVDQGARHLTLCGRKTPSNAAADSIRALQAVASVVVQSADVSDEAACARLLAQCAADMPLGGIIHAAGVLDDGALMQQSWARYRAVAAPKVEGAWNLHRQTRDRTLDFFIVFSSASATLGQPGQANYAAANAFLDALAHHRRAAGLRATSINWGPWAAGGMATAVSSSRWTAQGLLDMTPTAAIAAMQEAVGRDETQLTVARMDWPRFVAQLRPVPRAFAELAAPAPATPDAAPLLAALAGSPPVRRLPLLVEHVLRRAAKVLGLDADYPLDVHEGLRNVGLDSLLAVELRNVLQADTGLVLPVTLAFDQPTSDAIARHLAALLNLDLGRVDTAAERTETVPGIDELSDEAVEAMLAAELAELSDARERRS